MPSLGTCGHCFKVCRKLFVRKYAFERVGKITLVRKDFTPEDGVSFQHGDLNIGGTNVDAEAMHEKTPSR